MKTGAGEVNLLGQGRCYCLGRFQRFSLSLVISTSSHPSALNSFQPPTFSGPLYVSAYSHFWGSALFGASCASSLLKNTAANAMAAPTR